MIVPVSKENEKEWIELCIALWSDATADDLIEGRIAYNLSDFLYYVDNEDVAFISLSVRNEYVEGADSAPTGYLEGIYVKPSHQKQGIAKKMVEFAKVWSAGQGCTTLASDVELHNEDSRLFHERIGFSEVSRAIHFAMRIEQNKTQGDARC